MVKTARPLKDCVICSKVWNLNVKPKLFSKYLWVFTFSDIRIWNMLTFWSAYYVYVCLLGLLKSVAKFILETTVLSFLKIKIYLICG